jgi:hypothetical protein
MIRLRGQVKRGTVQETASGFVEGWMTTERRREMKRRRQRRRKRVKERALEAQSARAKARARAARTAKKADTTSGEEASSAT